MKLNNLFYAFKEFQLDHSELSVEKFQAALLSSWIPQHMEAHRFFNINFTEAFFLDKLPSAISFILKNNDSLFQDASELDNAFESVIKSYQRKFNDFDLCEYKAFALPTFGFFDAIATINGNDKAILFGLDTIEFLKQQYGVGANDFKTLVAHEVGHLYHFKCADISDDDVLNSQVSFRFWMEGIAQYLSKYICGDISLSEILLDQGLAERCEKIEKNLYQRLLSDIDNKRFGRVERFWFNLHNDEIPGRAGYYIGYKAVETCVNNLGIESALKLSPSSIHKILLEHIQINAG